MSEYLLVFAKNKDYNIGIYGGEADVTESQPIIKRTNKISTLKIPANVVFTKLEDGVYCKGIYGDNVNPVILLDDVVVEKGVIVNMFSISAPFVWSQKMFDEQLKKGARYVINTLNFQLRVYRIYEDDSFKGFASIVNGVEIKGTNEDAYEELEYMFGIKKVFDYSKPTNYVKLLINGVTHFDKSAIILDFFSGSATTAHAVMKLNAEDGGNRKFIMVQLPERTDDMSEAYTAGYDTICEIGKERIRRAGKKIKEESGLQAQHLDIGFRVLKLDSSNMEDVYYTSQEFTPKLLFQENVKADRSNEDLLFQVMLSLGIELSAKIETKQIAGKTVHLVDENYLAACFDSDVNETVITEIAQLQPVYFVMRDASAATDNVIDNFEQLFRHYSPDTNCRII